jgi:hypothetical protein
VLHAASSESEEAEDYPMSEAKASEWKETRSRIVGVDAWSGRGDVAGWCVLYEVTRVRGQEVEVRVKTGEAVYVRDLPDDAETPYAALLEMYLKAEKALRGYAVALERKKQ